MKIIILKSLIIVLVFVFNTKTIMGQKPAWIDNTPKAGNPTYKFVEVKSFGTDYASAKVQAKKKLAQDEQLIRSVNINVDTESNRYVDQTFDNGVLNESVRDRTSINVDIEGKKFVLQAVVVDEYGCYNDGMYELYTLFQVAVRENPVFDRTYLTTSYSVAPVFMSIIPGLGQWYKGSKAKGISCFVAEAVAVAGIIVCENQRASYIKKMAEQPRFAKEYNSKADNWEIGRNISIGVAAGIWIYNIIDAAVAKGARRVITRKTGRGGWSLSPMIDPHEAGVSFAYRF